MTASERRISILVVEDVDTMRNLLVTVLHGILNLRVSGTASNTWEARMELSRNRPDLVLLDEVLPGESSVDLLREIAAQSIPVLLLTEMESADRPIPNGALGRLTKPSWGSMEEDRVRFGATIRALMDGFPK